MRKLSNKQIVVFTVMAFIFVALLLATIYVLNIPKIEEPGTIATIIETPTINPVERTPEEEKQVVDKIVGESISGQVYEYRAPDLTGTEKRKVLEQASFDIYKQNILTLIGGQNYKAAADIANRVFSEYDITDERMNSFIISCQEVTSMENNDGLERFNYITSIGDPELYVLLFTQIPIEEQANLLPELSMEVLPLASSQEVTIVSVEEAGLYDSLAFKYFSDYENTIFKKILVRYENGEEYYIYYAWNRDINVHHITNIEKANPHAQTTTSYEEYMELYELEPYVVEYD